MAARSTAAARRSPGPAILAWVVLAALLLLLRVAHGAMVEHPRFAVEPRFVSVESRPAWMTPELAERVAADLSVSLGAPASLLDPRALAAWERHLPDASRWVEVVEGVQPAFPGRAEVRLRLRRPVLELSGGRLVAADGHHLGHGPVVLDPPLLQLVGSLGPDALSECAVAAADLEPFRAEIEEVGGVLIDRVLLSDQGRVVFLTARGVELEWGRSSAHGDLASVDLPPRKRVDNLLTVLEGRPGLYEVWRVVLWKDRPEVVFEP